MCSINEDVENEIENYIEKLDITKIKVCNKCRQENPIVLLRNKDGYCKTCFLNGTIHKFKAFLGKHRFIKKDDGVLVNYRPSHAVTSLLSFLRNGIDASTPKQLKFNPSILYIEKNYHLDVLERRNILKQISEHVQQFHFPVFFISFSSYVVSSKINLETDHRNVSLSENDIFEINKLCTNNVTTTVKTEVYKQFEKKLLLECAKKLACQHIFVCDIAIDIASQILTNVSLGRGSHLEMDIGICDQRDSDVNIISPLRVFDIKELALYNFFNKVNPVIYKKEHTDAYSSVQNLMTSFVQNLQQNFPSTITTVVKTGDKLSMDKKLLKNEKCQMCLLPIEHREQRLTSAEATYFSHWLSTSLPDKSMSYAKQYDQVFTDFKEDKRKYCFSCSRISEYIIKQ